MCMHDTKGTVEYWFIGNTVKKITGCTLEEFEEIEEWFNRKQHIEVLYITSTNGKASLIPRDKLVFVDFIPDGKV